MYSSLSIIRLAVYGISSQKAKIMKFLRVTNVKVPLLLAEQERALTAAMFIIAIIITLRALALRNDLNHHERRSRSFQDQRLVCEEERETEHRRAMMMDLEQRRRIWI